MGFGTIVTNRLSGPAPAFLAAVDCVALAFSILNLATSILFTEDDEYESEEGSEYETDEDEDALSDASDLTEGT